MRGLRNHVEYLANPTGPTVTGGTITTVGGYKYHTFTSTDTTGLVVTGAGSIAIDYILVGGGGASGGSASDAGNPGGGGAGGVLYASTTLSAGNYPVIIGAGGSGSNIVPDRNGNPSSWTTSSTKTPLTITLGGQRRTVRPAANGVGIWIGSNGGAGTSPWNTYQNLPAYLLGLPCTVEINQSDSATFTSNKAVRVWLIRDTTFTGVTLTGWTLYESSKNYISTYTGIQTYYRDYTAGTYTIDNNSALYMFQDTDATSITAQGGGFGGSYINTASPGSGGSGGGFAQQIGTYLGTTTSDIRIPGITGQGNSGAFHTRATNRPLSGQGGGGAGAAGGLNTLTNYTAKNSSGVDVTYVITGSSAGAGYQWLNGSYYGGGGGGSTHEWYPQGDWAPDTRTGSLQQPGGTGGGGNGRYVIQEMPTMNQVYGQNGTANTGGGGGGSGPSRAGTNGGSGIFIVRYAV